MTRQTVAQQQTPISNPLSSGILQRKCDCGKSAGLVEKCNECQRKPLTLKRKASNQNDIEETPPIVHEVLKSPGQPLDLKTRTFMESQFGQDFGQVRVHTGSKAAKSAQAIDSVAYTAKQDIVFGANQYMPYTDEGRKLIAHELAHIVHVGHKTYVYPGIAPSESLAEKQADLFASSIAGESITGSNLGPKLKVDNWGQAWQIHRQRPNVIRSQRPNIIRRGRTIRFDQILSEGDHGEVIGEVEVRTGEQYRTATGGYNPATGIPEEITRTNLIALDFRGNRAGNAHWIQFIWSELEFATTIHTFRSNAIIGNFHGGQQRYTDDPTTPNWYIDSIQDPTRAIQPFYDANGMSAGTSTPTSVSRTMWDMPGEGVRGTSQSILNELRTSQNPIISNSERVISATLRQHFDTYLILNGCAVHHTEWTATTVANNPESTVEISELGPIYSFGMAGPVQEIPANLRAVLRAEFNGFDIQSCRQRGHRQRRRQSRSEQ